MAQSRYFEQAYALTVGVGDQDIPQSVQDAEGIAHILTHPDKAAYNPEKVKVLTAEQSSREQMLGALNHLVDTVSPKAEHTVIIFYSGHGGEFKSADGSRKYFLCNHGFDESNPDETGISADEFTLLIQSIPSQRKLIMLDCCHAGGMILDNGQMVQEKFLGRFLQNSTYRGLVEKLGMGQGVVSLVSCDKDEKSVIFQKAQYSLFTEKVIEALEGYGSGQDDYVAVIDLINYVLKAVPRAYKKQNPKLKAASDLNASFALCRNSHPVGIEALPERLSGDLKNLQEVHDVALETAEPGMDYVLSVKGQIQQAVKKNKIDRALLLFEGLLVIIESTLLRNTIVLLNADYSQLRNRQLMGVITAENYKVELTNIYLRMLDCADRLEEFYQEG